MRPIGIGSHQTNRLVHRLDWTEKSCPEHLSSFFLLSVSRYCPAVCRSPTATRPPRARRRSSPTRVHRILRWTHRGMDAPHRAAVAMLVKAASQAPTVLPEPAEWREAHRARAEERAHRARVAGRAH